MLMCALRTFEQLAALVVMVQVEPPSSHTGRHIAEVVLVCVSQIAPVIACENCARATWSSGEDKIFLRLELSSHVEAEVKQ